MPRVANQVSVSAEMVQKVAKQLEHMENYECMRSPDTVRWQQDGSTGYVQFEYDVSNGGGD